MKKKVIIFTILILTLSLLLGLYSAYKQPKIETIEEKEKEIVITQEEPEKSFDDFENLSELTESEENIVTVSNVEVTNFAQNAELIPGGKAIIFEREGDYHILFHSQNELFIISILGSPFSEKRFLAEEAFLYKLGITKEEACKLNVVITTPMFANEAESGKNYKLSFCQ